MTSKTTSEQLEALVKAIIKDWTYPGGQELSMEERQKLVDQLKKVARDSNDVDETRIITDAFYKDKVGKHFRSLDTNFSWIFEILQHELVSASRLHKLLLDIAHEEHFSKEGIEKINHYFAESSDNGNNDNFITMSSMDVIDSIGRTKTFQANKYLDTSKDAESATHQKIVTRNKNNNDESHETHEIINLDTDSKASDKNKPSTNESKNRPDNIIKLKDY